MPIRSLAIDGFRGFASRQVLEFAQPTGQSASGYTVLVGANNSGKSTLIEALQFLQRHDSVPPFPEAQRHSAAGGRVQIEYKNDAGSEWRLSTGRLGGGAAEWFLPGGSAWLGGRVFVVPARRVFDDTAYGRPQQPTDLREQFVRSQSLGTLRAQRGGLGERLYAASKRREAFDDVLSRILRPVPDWYVVPKPESGPDQYSLRFRAGAAAHPAEGVGEGIVSLFWIVDALYDSKPGEVIVIDEPELSLHPFLQRRLARVLDAFSSDRQIICATHSPYFLDWGSVLNGAHVARVFQKGGGSQVANLERRTVVAMKGVVADRNNPHVLGLDAREVFFLEDGVILTEGQDDVTAYRRLVADLNVDLSGEFFGWGVGGADKMSLVAQLLHDLGFERVVGILDNTHADVADALNSAFPDYEFFTIPAADVRTKKARKAVAAVDGLLDSQGTVRPEYKDSMVSLFKLMGERLRNPVVHIKLFG